MPFVVFCSATVWAGGVAAQRPITCPNRQLQPERCATVATGQKNGIKMKIKRRNCMKTWKQWTLVAILAFFGIIFGFIACDNDNGKTDPKCTCPNGTVHTEAICSCEAVGYDCNCTYEPPHIHEWEWALNAIAATCTTASKDIATCKIATCTETNERTGSITSLGHDEGQWNITKDATTTETGTKKLQCTRCEFVLDTDTIPIIPFDHITFSSEQIPVFIMTEGVTETQMTNAIANIQEAYDGLDEWNGVPTRVYLLGKIDEFYIFSNREDGIVQFYSIHNERLIVGFRYDRPLNSILSRLAAIAGETMLPQLGLP
jgi:hypothetical protein